MKASIISSHLIMDIGGTSPIIPMHHHHYDEDVTNRYVIDDDEDDNDDNDDEYHLGNSNRRQLEDIDVQHDDDVFNSTSSYIQSHRNNTTNESSIRSQQRSKNKLIKNVSNSYYNKFRNNNNNNNDPHHNNDGNDIEDDNCSVMSNQTYKLQSQHRRQLQQPQHDEDESDHDQLPNIEIYKATMNNNNEAMNHKRSSSSFIIFILSNFYLTIFCVCIFFCVIALTIGFVIGENSISTTQPQQSNNNITSSNNNNNIIPSSSTIAPLETTKSRLELAIELVIQEEWSDIQTLSNINNNNVIDTVSSQYLALQWLANDDAVQIDIKPSIDFIQRYVLAILYYSTNGGNNTHWEYSYNFLNPNNDRDDHVCNWSMLWNVKNLEPTLNENNNDMNDNNYYQEVGIICDYIHSYITQIYIPNNNLYGTIPSEIRLLTNLKEFNLYNNLIYGIIPSELSQLLNLEALILHTNQINDTIPLWLPSLFKLNIFNIGNNPNIYGILPFNINQIQNLTVLNIENCNLYGNLTSLYGLKNIKSIHISKNAFTGTLSNDIFDTWKDTIIELDISQNQFTGTLPTQLFNADYIMIIDVSSNSFIGPVFQNVQIFLQNNIQLLAFHNNMLNGTIYPTITEFQQLQHLDISNNTFTGYGLQTIISILHSLKYLYISFNPYFISSTIPSEIQYLTNLIDISLQKSNIIGTIPYEISYLTNLILLDLNDNILSSTIPKEIGNQLTNLHFLLLQNNQLNGTIPTTFIQLTALDTLLINGNKNINGGVNELCTSFMEIMDDDVQLLNTFMADCQPFITNNDNCTCCTICCDDDSNSEDNIAYCTKQTFFQNFDPSNQYHYTRRFYQLNEEELLYPVDPMSSNAFYNDNIMSSNYSISEYGPIMDNTPIIGNNNDDIMFYTDDESGIEIDDEMLLDYTDSEYFGNPINISTSP